MIFQSIRLANFKCYSAADIEFHPGLNCIVGNNGAGKTNLLDALYYCCFTKSYFASSDQYVQRHGETFFRMEGRVIKDDEEFRIVIKAQEQKSIELNERPIARRSDYIGKFNAVMIAPDDNQIILGGSELRRKFMDGCIGQYSHEYLHDLLDYQKLLRQRNALLKQYLKTRNLDRILLETIDERLCLLGDSIHRFRQAFILEFRTVFVDKFNSIAGIDEQAGIDYVSPLSEGKLAGLFKEHLQQDMAVGRTTCGPHRDDLKFAIFDRPLKTTGSQGQQKSFLVALKLAQYDLIAEKKEQRPFLFLDDLFDKFDPDRIAHIMALVKEGHFGQVFITDTGEERMDAILKKYNLDHLKIRVENAQIQYG